MRNSWLYLATRSERLPLPGLVCPTPVGHREVRDEGVLGFARAVRDDGAVAAALGEVDALEGLGERADLVQLDEDRVGDPLLDPAREALDVGDEDVVADDRAAVAKR